MEGSMKLLCVSPPSKRASVGRRRIAQIQIEVPCRNTSHLITHAGAVVVGPEPFLASGFGRLADVVHGIMARQCRSGGADGCVHSFRERYTIQRDFVADEQVWPPVREQHSEV